MPRAPSLSLSQLADRCASLRQLHQVHGQMVVTGRVADTYALSRLLSFAALHPSGRHLPYAESLLAHSPSPANSFLFNTLIRAFSLSPTPSRSLLLYRQMLLHASPGKHTFPFLLKACSNLRSRSAAITRQVHAHVLKYGLGSDSYVVNALVLSYSSRAESLSDAREVFDCAKELNCRIWTTIISGYSHNLLSAEAIRLFREMVGSGVEPCGATLSSVLSACARSGGLELGRRIHGYIAEKGMEVGVILGTALVDMYAKNGAILVARELFEGMPEKNVVTWNAMICGSAHHGHADSALELFRELERKVDATGTVRPNDVTFVGVLTACCHAGLEELGRRIFRSMEEKYGVEPKVEHYGCMVDLLGRNGRLEEAEEMVRGMKWKADIVVWGALLTACRNYGNIETAERVVEEMLRLDPENHGVYVVLSNMYAGVGRWEDVERLRRTMIDGGLKKIPGWSCVDGHGVGSHNADRFLETAIR